MPDSTASTTLCLFPPFPIAACCSSVPAICSACWQSHSQEQQYTQQLFWGFLSSRHRYCLYTLPAAFNDLCSVLYLGMQDPTCTLSNHPGSFIAALFWEGKVIQNQLLGLYNLVKQDLQKAAARQGYRAHGLTGYHTFSYAKFFPSLFPGILVSPA